MTVFDARRFTLHKEVVFRNDPRVGLRAIIAIHDLTFGPALGGLRIYPYATEQDAIEDVLRLARGLTYKTALAGLGPGAGQSFAAKRLHPDHRADHVAVGIQVAHQHALAHELGGGVDATVNAERQAVAGAVDGVAHRIEVGDLEQPWREEGAVHAILAQRRLEQCLTPAHAERADRLRSVRALEARQ